MKSPVVSKLVLLVCLCGTAFAHAATATDPCREAATLWTQRQTYDIEARTQRHALRQKIIEAKIADNVMEQKVIDLDRQIIAAPEDARDALWQTFDMITHQWDEQHRLNQPLYAAYDALSYDRPLKRFELKLQELKARVACALNQPLATAIEATRTQLAHSPLSAAERAQFEEIAQKRHALTQTFIADFAKLETILQQHAMEIRANRQQIVALHAQADQLDAKQDQQYDDAGQLLEAFTTQLQHYREDLTKLSEVMLPFTQSPAPR